MKDKKLATRYARALLSALPEVAAQDAADSFLTALGEALEGQPGVRAFLENPSAPAGTKKELFGRLATQAGAGQRVVTFLGVVVDHGRVSSLPSIAKVLRTEREAMQGTITGTLTTASPVNAETAGRIAAALSRLAGRRVNLTTGVDPALLGGAIARVGSTVYDGSLRTQLERLRRTMGEE
ncbi:MAG TPA: ATP synthase F1 subunit delta [Candidatus Polarisedimenticolaceae bacterium]|nr:ATP synthase F1 subunit delta [Candidatus Polarisedimenticolaceae bacterium]